MLQRAFTDVRVDSRQPLVVLAVSDETSLRELLPQYWEHKRQHPVAAYWGGPNRNCIAIRVDVPDREAFRRVLHEYVHLLTHANVRDLPPWLDEGLAEFWSAAVVQDDAVEIGRPAARDLQVLHSSRSWIPLAELLTMKRVPDARDKQRLSLFYAQSWALTHYLLLGSATSTSKTLELAPSTQIADVSHLESALSAYVRNGRLRALRIEIPQPIDRAEDGGLPLINVRTVGVAQSLAVRAGCLADGERPAAAQPLLTQALAADPNDPSVLETLGYLRFQQNKPTDAAAWFDRAIATGQAGYLAYFYRAILAGPVPTQAGGAGRAGGAGETVPAADYLKKTIELNPGFAPAYARLADIYGGDSGRQEEALPLMRRAVELEPDNPTYRIGLGKLLAGMSPKP